MGQGLGVERGFYRPGLAHNNPVHAHTHTTSGPTAGSVPQRTGAAEASAPELREVTVVRSLDRSALFLRVLRDNTLARLLPVAGTIWRRGRTGRLGPRRRTRALRAVLPVPPRGRCRS